jgi:hypothetical protein
MATFLDQYNAIAGPTGFNPLAPSPQSARSPMDFGGLLFGGMDGGLNEYLTDAQRQAMQRQAMLSAGAALLKSSGRSTTPVSLGQALGQGLEAGAAGYQQAQEGAMKQLLTKQKLDEYKRQMAVQDQLSKIFTDQGQPVGGAITPMQAAALPVDQYGMGPSPQRAAMIGQPTEAPAVSQEDIQYNKYMQAARLFAAVDPAKSKAYMDQALLIKPKTEVVGEPYRTADGKTYQRTKTGGRIEVPAAEAPAVEPLGEMKEVTDASGKPVLVQR